MAFASSADPTGENPDGNTEIFVIDATTGAIRQLTVTNPIGEGYSLRPSISGDGSLVAFKSENTYVPLGFPLVFVMSTTGGDPVLISPMPDCAETLACNQSFAPAISGNGKKIAFLSADTPEGGTDLFLANSDGSNVRRLSFDGRPGSPSIDNSGDRIAVDVSFSPFDGLPKILLYGPQLSEGILRLDLTEAQDPQFTFSVPKISGNGARVFIDVNFIPGTPGALWLARSTGSGLRKLFELNSFNAFVSDDGQRLAINNFETGEILAVSVPFAPLRANPSSLSFSFVQLAEAAIRRLFVSNTTTDSLPFQVQVTTQSGSPWLSVTPENGDVTPTEAVALTVRADPGGLPPGTYLGEIRISSSAVPQVMVVPVTMAISRRQQLLRLSQTGATFIAVSGAGPVLLQSFRVLNDGLGLLQWNITPTTLSGGPWLSAEPAAGMTNAASSSAVEIRVDPTGLEPGVYYGVLEVAAPEAASSPQFVTVVLALLAPGTETRPAVFPTGLVFATLENGPAPDSQSVKITNLTSSALSFTSSRSTVDGNDWFVQTPNAGMVPPAGMLSIDVQADPTGLAAGIYRGTLTLSFDDGSTATVDLVFVVVASETNLKQVGRLQSACQRSELAPVFRLLGTTSAIPAAWPARIEVGVVDNCGNPMQEGLVEVEFSNIASPNLALGRSEPGVWSGTWDVPNTDQQVDGLVTATATDAEGLTGSFTARVALAPNAAPAPQVNTGGVVHAASFVAEPLAPGTIISIFGSALSQEPTDGGQLAASLPLPSDLAGTEITIGGVPVPLIFSREDQVNAVIPFELLDRANETLPVLVHRIGARSVSVSEPVLVTAARPGVFTLNASGRGAAVIQDADFGTVTFTNPVVPGDVIQIFCTGLGPVEPEVPSGAAAPLSPLSWVIEDVEVTIGGVPATVSFAGLYQINAFVPVGISLGQPQLVVSIAGQKSQVVTVDVR